jgi:hypothetical protein
MTSYAVIKDNVVSNVIVADTKEIAESLIGLTCIEITPEPGAPGIGWAYDGVTFTAPIIQQPIVEELIIDPSLKEFLIEETTPIDSIGLAVEPVVTQE